MRFIYTIIAALAITGCSVLPVTDPVVGVDSLIITEATSLYYLISDADTQEQREVYIEEAVTLLTQHSYLAEIELSDLGRDLAAELVESEPRLQAYEDIIAGIATYIYQDQEKQTALSTALEYYALIKSGDTSVSTSMVLDFLSRVEAFDDVPHTAIGVALAEQFLHRYPEYRPGADVIYKIASYAFVGPQ